MPALSDLPNLGKVVAAQLERAGIRTPADLKRAGAVGAAVKLEATGVSVCASKLSALEGAIRGVRWHTIPSRERKALQLRLEERLARVKR
jgi:DNA transformation protein and related proteins